MPEFSVTLHDGSFLQGASLERIELDASRRALSIIKNKLGSAGLHALLADELDETDRVWEELASQSAGKWNVETIEFSVEGLSLDFWLPWLKSRLEDERMQFEAHPEHYTWRRASLVDPAAPEDAFMITETFGDFIRRGYLRLERWDGAEAFEDPEYPVRMHTASYSRNGVLFGRGLGQYREEPDGFRFRYHGFKPARIPRASKSVQEHVYLEYVYYMRQAQLAYSATGGQSAAPRA